VARRRAAGAGRGFASEKSITRFTFLVYAASVDVDALVARARDAQGSWAALGHAQRARRLLACRARLARNAAELAEMAHAETGKPVLDALFEVAAGCAMLGWVAAHAKRFLSDRRVATRPFVVKRATVHYEPLGVIGVISPWNYPIGIPLQSLPYALGAGNTVVFKPSELTPETGRMLSQCFAPAGDDVVVLAHGDATAGARLVTSGIDKLVFTGSPATARRILTLAAERLLPVVLELGGKDAMIVCSDANLDHAASALVGAAFANAGQTCMASERALVDEAVYDRFVDKVLELAAGLTLQRGPTSWMAPVARPEQIDLVEKRLAAAVSGGATILLGGHRLPDSPAYFAPTVVVGVPRQSELWREESFAPVVSIAPFKDEEEAVALANDSSFGLSSSIFTRDRRKARALASRISAGGVNINDAMTGAAIAGLPFGGVKRSGYGRLQGPEGLWELSRTTSIVEPRLMGAPSLVGTMFGPRRPSRRTVEGALRALWGRPR
jgi:succinate-semialdehyde dehydrogenase/glutarate-semialdehyde dehydrogenase